MDALPSVWSPQALPRVKFGLCEPSFLLNFHCVCPEPVLVRRRFHTEIETLRLTKVGRRFSHLICAIFSFSVRFATIQAARASIDSVVSQYGSDFASAVVHAWYAGPRPQREAFASHEQALGEQAPGLQPLEPNALPQLIFAPLGHSKTPVHPS